MPVMEDVQMGMSMGMAMNGLTQFPVFQGLILYACYGSAN